MKITEEFKKKIEAEIALLEAQLIRFKVRGMGFTTEAKERHNEHVEKLEERIDEINLKLNTLDKADEKQFEILKSTIKNRLLELKAAFQKITEAFNTEPGVADAHGGDDGSYPYGKGLSGRSSS